MTHQKSIEKKLSNNTSPKTTNYNSYDAHETFNFIDIEFYLELLTGRIGSDNWLIRPKNSGQIYT